MAAITIVRARENWKPGHKVWRGTGSMNSTDASGTLQVPAGNIIGFRGNSVGSTTVEYFGLTDAPNATSGVISPTTSGGVTFVTVARSGSGSGLNFFFEIEFDSQ